MVLTSVVTLVASGIAVATDMTQGRIKNWLTIPLILSGLAFAAWRSGWSGVVYLYYLPVYHPWRG